jgi:hypothetical protein
MFFIVATHSRITWGIPASLVKSIEKRCTKVIVRNCGRRILGETTLLGRGFMGKKKREN